MGQVKGIILNVTFYQETGFYKLNKNLLNELIFWILYLII